MILRLKEPQDAEAWEEFVELYMPVIQRIARSVGLNSSDAEDPCQEVLIRLSTAVEKWNPDQSGATFKGWLYHVARNTLLNYVKSQNVRRRNHLQFVNDQGWLARGNDPESYIDLEFAKQLFVVAANKIKGEFLPQNWSAFWLTYVDQLPISDVAQQLSVKKSRVYVARCRIVSRLKIEIERMTSGDMNILESSSSVLAKQHQADSKSEDGNQKEIR